MSIDRVDNEKNKYLIVEINSISFITDKILKNQDILKWNVKLI